LQAIGLPNPRARGKHQMTVGNQTITRPDEGTRERIVTEAIRLFALNGFTGTTVGDIEQAAGLARRAGGLYRHFRSKEEVLSAAIDRHVREMQRIRERFDVMPLGDLRAELTLAARWALGELRAEQLVMKVVQKDGDRFPRVVAEVHERIIAPGHAQAAEMFTRVFAEAGIEDREARAYAAVALGALVGYVIEQSMFGAVPGEVAEADFVEAWVDTWETYVRKEN
jgi:AcrR family transcriptional regulator